MPLLLVPATVIWTTNCTAVVTCKFPCLFSPAEVGLRSSTMNCQRIRILPFGTPYIIHQIKGSRLDRVTQRDMYQPMSSNDRYNYFELASIFVF